METIRLYTWPQITTNGFIPTNKFIVPYYSVNGTNSSLVFTGQCFIEASGLTNGYKDDLKKVTVRVDWGGVGTMNRSRIMTTYVSKWGLQSYVY